MPRAAKSTTRGSAAASRTDPLRSKSGRSKVKQETAADAAADSASTVKLESSPDPDAKQLSTTPGIDPGSNYLVIVHMTLSSDPIITRLLSLPPHMTFDIFHEVLQIAFGWANCHMHSFHVTVIDAERPYPRPVVDLQAILLDDIPDLRDTTLLESNYTLDDVFSRRILSDDVLSNTQWKGKVTPEMEMRLEYEYDMGDGWSHQITLLGRADPGLHRSMGGPDAPAILCLGGEGHPCAEDCGSEPGWQNLKEIFTKPRKKDPDDLKGWYKSMCANRDPDGLNPWKWDIFEVNSELGKLKI